MGPDVEGLCVFGLDVVGLMVGADVDRVGCGVVGLGVCISVALKVVGCGVTKFSEGAGLGSTVVGILVTVSSSIL